MLNSTKFGGNLQVSASNFVIFDAPDIDTVFFDAVPQAALIDPQQFGGSDLDPAGLPKGFDDHTFFDFLEALIQWQVDRQRYRVVWAVIIELAGDFGG